MVKNFSSEKIAVSLSNGSIMIAHQLDTGLTVTDTWIGHDFEPWITAWDRWDHNLIYTGMLDDIFCISFPNSFMQ